MKYNHIILCKLHLLLCQNVEILQTHIVLLIEETLLLDTCHVEHIKLSHGILELFYLLELDIVGTKHIIAQKNPFFHPTMLFRRAVLESVNGYSTSPETRRTEDYDLVMRLAANGVIGENLQEILYSVYEPQEAYLRHNARTRMYEVRVRARGLRALIEKRSVTMFDDYSNGKRCLNTSTPIFDEKGNVWRVIASIRDMTELETLQRKLTDLEMETLAYKARLENLETEMDAGFVGHSAPMRRLRKEASKAARTEAITLILGETGTGKTLTAKAIHDMSQRSAEPFIAVNCGAIPMSLMESELFGYEKGAFTGAAKSGKPGMFELAHKGTLLLDEIGELPLPMQAKLLQVLDGHPFHRVGGTKPITVDVRVIAATNKPLADMAASGQFREDLFYRLRVLTVEIPPLRERPDDIPVLAMHFLQEIIKKSGLQKNFDPQVLNCFLTYRWPGNVRELRALVQSLATMSEEETITMQDLPQYMQAQSPLPQGSVSFRQPMREAVAELERNMIMAALTETGSTYKAARRLKVSQSTIVRKAQRYKIGLVEIPHK